MSELSELWRKLQNIVKFTKQTLVPDDSGDYQKVQNKFLGQTQDIRQITPYGFYSSSPIGSEWIIFSLRSNPDDKVGIGNKYPTRFKGLKEGEVAIYNQLTGSYIFLDAAANINVVGKKDLNVTIDVNENVLIKGNSTVQINGDRTITIDGNRTSTVKGDSEETIEGNETREVQGTSEHTYKDTLDKTVEGDETTINQMSVSQSVLLNKSETVIGTKTIAIPTTNHTGNINLVGNYNIVGELTVNGIAFSTHVHGGVQSGPSDTDGPENPD